MALANPSPVSWLHRVQTLLLNLHEQYTLPWTWLGGLLYVALIVLSMIHALRNKRNIRAATGWIGLMWFAPVVGIILYYLFGINRIQRRAKSRLQNRSPINTPEPSAGAFETSQVEDQLSPKDSHLGSLARLTQGLTQLPLLDGNSIEPLFNGTEAYPAMMDAIDQAEDSISLCSYIFAGSGIGKQFVEKLIAADKRGVEIRVIVDDVGARHSNPSAVKQLNQSSIPVERFMHTWLPWKFRYANLRNHRKIMVVDGKLGFTGGMNISKLYWKPDRPSGEAPHRDLHFKLEGPIVSHLQYTFAEDWVFCHDEELAGEKWFPDPEPSGTVLARGISHGPDADYDKIRNTLLGAIATAEHSIRIVTPYFLPDEDLITALQIASMRDISTNVYIPENINLKLLQWASQSTFEELLSRDVKIHRTPEPFDHSKIMVVDNSWVLLGSTNWDQRSLKLNFEFNVECYNKELSSKIVSHIKELEESARTLQLEDIQNRSFPAKVRDDTVRLFTPYL
ncbi:MAG: cardiolipin synthase [bacterium]